MSLERGSVTAKEAIESSNNHEHNSNMSSYQAQKRARLADNSSFADQASASGHNGQHMNGSSVHAGSVQGNTI